MTRTTAGAVLATRLGSLGVEFIFANSGTDFPPVIEGLAEAAAKNMPVPQAVTVPHESAAVAMAHGYTLATGRPQAVMVHTNVGLANAAIGAINARSDNVPMLIFSGRTPTSEKDRFGTRTVPIGWGQEMSDQHALIREACKWDYELRFPEMVAELTDRAYGISCSVPYGPVYVSLPREVLCEAAPAIGKSVLMQPSIPVAQSSAIAAAARILAGAKKPLIIAQRGAGSPEAFAALTRLVERWAIPVCQYWALRVAIPTDHPMSSAPDPTPLIAEADVILVLDSLAPWQPDRHEPMSDATVIQMGQDPLFAQTPVRNFRSDMSLPGELSANILALAAAMDSLDPGCRAERFRQVATKNAEDWADRETACAQDAVRPHVTKRWISARLAEIAGDKDGTIFSELGVLFSEMRLRTHYSWFESPHSGGLGFGLPASLGYKLATPDRLIIAALGDGSYMFANPIACLQVAKSLNISTLVVVLNNAEWGAVRQSVEALYPDGYAVRSNQIPLTDLSPTADYAKIATACGVWGRKARDHQEFLVALDEAVRHVEMNRGLALIDVTVART